jgi:hypothetical protein
MMCDEDDVTTTEEVEEESPKSMKRFNGVSIIDQQNDAR